MTNPDQIDVLATRVSKLNDKQERWFYAATINAGLMKFEQPDQDFINEIFQRGGVEPTKQEDVIVSMFQVAPNVLINDFAEQFEDHMLNGEGFDDKEIILLTGLLEYAETV